MPRSLLVLAALAALAAILTGLRHLVRPGQQLDQPSDVDPYAVPLRDSYLDALAAGLS